ncbi:MAG: LLM class flavin-dependent oxidoreductase [Candidatus Rokubacteria bacterium]|nr:LLM class flavin-dependent oxidoreductase [Candidatus Rokubacteria bacterium]
MKLGICVPHYGRPIEVDRVLSVVRRAEARGLDSVWVTDHVVVPRDVGVIYRDHMLDPLAVLPWLAGVTERITLGTSVVVLPYRSPLPVAKLLASVDVLSGGRLIVGAAVGWLEGEFAALGIPFRERGSRTDEALELIRAVWTSEYPEVRTARHRVDRQPGPPAATGARGGGRPPRAPRRA